MRSVTDGGLPGAGSKTTCAAAAIRRPCCSAIHVPGLGRRLRAARRVRADDRRIRRHGRLAEAQHHRPPAGRRPVTGRDGHRDGCRRRARAHQRVRRGRHRRRPGPDGTGARHPPARRGGRAARCRPPGRAGRIPLQARAAGRRAAQRLRIAPQSVAGTGAMLTDATRAAITAGFGVPVSNSFACTEGLARPERARRASAHLRHRLVHRRARRRPRRTGYPTGRPRPRCSSPTCTTSPSR